MEVLKTAGWLFAMLISVSANASTVRYSLVEPGASFEAVLGLPAGEPEVVHRYGEAKPQFVELWLPAGDHSVPVIAFIHGGCWLNRFGIDQTRPLATALVQSGYAVWNIEYRRVGDAGGGWPGSLEDIRAALVLLESLESPRLDLERLVLAGHSAGGHLALLAAGNLPTGVEARAVLGLAPITDMATYAQGEGFCNRAALEFFGPGGPVAEANPASRPAPAGTVIFLGSMDRIVPYQTPAVEPHTMVGLEAGHFDWIHPGTPAWDRFLQELRRALQ